MQRCLGCMREYKAEFDVCPYCGYIKGTEAKSRNHLEPGTEIANRYIIGKSLGQGGFGITYIAWDNKIQKTVTIKEFFPNALSTRGSGEISVSCFNDRAEAFFKEGMRKMLDEGRRLSKFTDNENIVDVYDFFEENNTSYIVMEYLSGKDLKQHLEENGGKLSPEEAVEIILPVLNALSDMHKEQLIHRDIAPDNIFLCDNGKIKLLDFGSARLAVDESEKSLSIMLKHGFAPKEQYSSRSKQGPWTDVYSVCATLYRMITGEVPPDSIDRNSAPLKGFKEFGINGFTDLEKVILKGLEIEHEDRYQSVKELEKALVLAVEKRAAKQKSKAIKKEKTKSVKSDKLTKDSKPKDKKIINKAVFAAVAAIVLISGVVSGAVYSNRVKKNIDISSNEPSTSMEGTTSTSTAFETTMITTAEDISKKQQEIKEKAVKAYEKKLLDLELLLESTYVTDINKDGIPEVFYRLAFGQGALTYTEKNGLSSIEFYGHSSMNPDIFISDENCIYIRDDGHNQGTASYHHAEFYSINETGFVKTNEVDGEEWEDFDWNNEELFVAIDAKYEKIFEDKLEKIKSGKTFDSYPNVAVFKNPYKYLDNNLSTNLASKTTNATKEIYLNYFESKDFKITLPDETVYTGIKNTSFFDLDNDGIPEGILYVSFDTGYSLPYFDVYIYDLEYDKIIESVYSIEGCGYHRSQNRFQIFYDGNAYYLHKHIVDPHFLAGTIYSYDGNYMNLVFEGSYYCDITNGVAEEKHFYLYSDDHDLAFESAENYIDYKNENGDIRDGIQVLTKENFYNRYDGYYNKNEIFIVPSYEYVVSNKSGANIRSGPGSDYNKLGALNYGETIFGLRFEYPDDKNGWIKILYNGKAGWVALSNLDAKW